MNIPSNIDLQEDDKSLSEFSKESGKNYLNRRARTRIQRLFACAI